MRTSTIAVIGESQVGKSSLVNALLGARLLPTTGVGAPRSQAPCECSLPGQSTPAQWQVQVELRSLNDIERAIMNPSCARGHLLRRGLEEDCEAELANAWRSLPLKRVVRDVISALAVGRNTSWIRLDYPITPRDVRRQLDPLTGGWSAAITRNVRLMAPACQTTLVDLPGVGHSDAGGEATRGWLDAKCTQVAAVVCVIGQRGFGDTLAEVLLRYWRAEELLPRLHLVATFGDRLVEEPDRRIERDQVVRTRRMKAFEQALKLFGARDSDLFDRTYCIDPRPESRWWAPVHFDGELARLRHALAAVKPPPQLLHKPLCPTEPPLAPPLPNHICAESEPQREPSTRLALRAGETMRDWLTRAFAPLLRGATWRVEPAKGRGFRHILTSRTPSGRVVHVVSISGSGKAYFKLSINSEEIQPPDSEREARLLRKRLLKIARQDRLTVLFAERRNTKGNT